LRKLGLVLVFIPAVAWGDQVFLKDAGSIEGRIVEQTAELVRVEVGGGSMAVPMDRVERIVKGRSALDEYDDRAKKLAPNDVAGWNKLGKFASDNGLSTRARDAYTKVLAAAPNDPQANAAMGKVQLDGKWVTEEESYRARGYVEYQNEWMTPAEAQVLQTEAANDQARRDAEQRARDAETAQREAEDRAKDAEERAKEAESRQNYYDPVLWGGYGYGVTSWPAQPAPTPVFTPTTQLKLNRVK
jgi:hypothetical protein